MAEKRRSSPSDDRLVLLGEAAQLYYVEHYTQDRIARQLDLSRSNVSRMLKEARELGLVEIRVRPPLEVASDLGYELRSRLGLRECLVLSSRRGSSGPEDASSALGAFGARFMQETIVDGDIIGVGWSNAVHGVVRSGHLREREGVTVVPLIGSLGSVPDLDGASTSGALARSLGAGVHFLQAPILVADRAVRDGLLRDKHIAGTLALARRADIMMAGVGTIDTDMGQYRAGYLDDESLGYIHANEAVGEICGSYFAVDGTRVPLEMNERTMGLGFEDLVRIPVRVAMGWGARKAPANIGAARAGLVNVLVTGEETAKEMLRILEAE